ncbi:MAG: rod shape-determining protein MreC [Collinsella sp.]
MDKGSADGLTINMPVTSSPVLSARSSKFGQDSTVRLIGDENSGVSAMVQDTRAQGMLQGQADGTLRLEYVSVDLTLRWRHHRDLGHRRCVPQGSTARHRLVG